MAAASDLHVSTCPVADRDVADRVAWSACSPAMPLDVALMAALVAIGLGALGSWRGGADALATVSARAVSGALPRPADRCAGRGARASRGPPVLFLLMLTVMVSDTAQYYTGRAFGTRPLAPAISPKKTVEGAIGGFVFGTALFVAAGAWWVPTHAGGAARRSRRSPSWRSASPAICSSRCSSAAPA